MLNFKHSILVLLIMVAIAPKSGAQSVTDRDLQEDWSKAVEAYKKGDRDNSIPFFMIAAYAGFQHGAHAMGIVYEDGTLVPQNSKLAMKYFICNAETGYFKSQLKLMISYQDGVLVSKNLGEAYFWALIASANVSDLSPTDKETKSYVLIMRNGLAKKISNDVIEKMQKKAQVWKPSKKECYLPN